MIPQNFGKIIRSHRKDKKATLKEMSEHVGISIGYLSDIEHGRKNPPKLDTISRMEDFLGVPDGELLTIGKTERTIPMRCKNCRYKNFSIYMGINENR